MSNLAQLLAHLKALKLSGIAESLEMRLTEAQRNDLSFSEFMAMILTDELQVRSNRKLQRLLVRAHAESSKTLESFDFGFAQGVNASQIRELSGCRFIEKGENIFFIGPTGTGKTHLAKALAHAACRQHRSVEFFNFQELFHALKQADLANALHRRMRTLKTTEVLILDDFAFKKLDQQSAEYFYMIVDARYSTKSIILTTNRALSDWDAFFPDPIMANALMDRLAHNAHQIVIKGESYRKKLKPSQDRK